MKHLASDRLRRLGCVTVRQAQQGDWVHLRRSEVSQRTCGAPAPLPCSARSDLASSVKPEPRWSWPQPTCARLRPGLWGPVLVPFLFLQKISGESLGSSSFLLALLHKSLLPRWKAVDRSQHTDRITTFHGLSPSGRRQLPALLTHEVEVVVPSRLVVSIKHLSACGLREV